MTSQQKTNSTQALSFEDVSKFFSLPLSEAADILGVSTYALKAICNENGLERWPHRKYLAGKSIEEIKIEAAKEKSKILGGSSQVDKQRDKTAMGSTVSPSIGSQLKDKSSRPASEISRSHGFTQQPGGGGRKVFSYRSQNLFNQGFAVEIATCLDEFKDGFPSKGLSTYSNKWWGGAKCDGGNGSVDDSATIRVAESGAQDLVADKQEPLSLSALRKQAVEEGREALKLGVWKEYGVDTLGEKERLLLNQLFRKS